MVGANEVSALANSKSSRIITNEVNACRGERVVQGSDGDAEWGARSRRKIIKIIMFELKRWWKPTMAM